MFLCCRSCGYKASWLSKLDVLGPISPVDVLKLRVLAVGSKTFCSPGRSWELCARDGVYGEIVSDSSAHFNMGFLFLIYLMCRCHLARSSISFRGNCFICIVDWLCLWEKVVQEPMSPSWTRMYLHSQFLWVSSVSICLVGLLFKVSQGWSLSCNFIWGSNSSSSLFVDRILVLMGRELRL